MLFVRMGYVIGECMRRSNLHLISNPGGKCIESPPEHPGERKGIVDLVREIAPAGPDQRSSRPPGGIRHDLRYGICHGKDDRLVIHPPDHCLVENARSRNPDEDIRTLHRVRKGSRPPRAVGLICQYELVFVAVEAFPGPVDDTLRIADHDIPDALADIRVIPYAAKEPGDRIPRCSCPADNDVQVLEILFCGTAGIEKGCEHGDGSAVLVIMHNRDADILEGLFDLKTTRGGNILEVYSPENRGDVPHLVWKIRVGTLEAEGECIDTREFLEEDGFSFHHRYGSIPADVTEPENRRSVRDYRDGIPLEGVTVCQVFIPLDSPAYLSNTRGICPREVPPGLERHFRSDLKLAMELLVELQCFPVHCVAIPFLVHDSTWTAHHIKLPRSIMAPVPGREARVKRAIIIWI